MGSLFDDLEKGLQEAIDFEKGRGKAKTTTLMIEPVKKYSNEDIKRIRHEAGMTQSVFAKYMGVSPKTVEAWELGRTHPTGVFVNRKSGQKAIEKPATRCYINTGSRLYTAGVLTA